MLTPEQIADYQRDGYIVVPNLLTTAECDTFLAHEASRDHSVGYGLHGHVKDPAWHTIAAHPNIAGPVAELLGGPVKIVQTMYLAKPAKGGIGIALHQDSHYLPNTPNTLMACWLALSDTDPDNGGLCVAPGTQTGPLRSAHKAKDTSEHTSWTQDYDMVYPDGTKSVQTMFSFEIDDIAESELVRLTVPKGSGVFFSGMVIHGSFANHSSDRPRLALATHFVRQDTWLFRGDVHEAMPV